MSWNLKVNFATKIFYNVINQFEEFRNGVKECFRVPVTWGYNKSGSTTIGTLVVFGRVDDALSEKLFRNCCIMSNYVRISVS